MELKIIQQEKQALPRSEVQLLLKYDKSTPSRKDLRSQVAKTAKAKEDLVIIRKVETVYGTRTANITAYVYEDEESMKKIENDKMLEKNIPKKAEEASEEAE